MRAASAPVESSRRHQPHYTNCTECNDVVRCSQVNDAGVCTLCLGTSNSNQLRGESAKKGCGPGKILVIRGRKQQHE